MTRTVPELEAALARCLGERDEAIGECARMRERMHKAAFDLAAARSVIRTQLPAALPYPRFCSTPEKCCGKSNCQADPCCAD